jgi:hypothetical protein
MADTPQQVASAAVCYDCIPQGYRESAMIYLLAQIAGSTMTPSELAAAAVCYDCIPTGYRLSVIVYLLAQIAAGGAAGGGGVTCGAVDPVAAPSGSCALYYNTSSGALFLWDGAAWQFKA